MISTILNSLSLVCQPLSTFNNPYSVTLYLEWLKKKKFYSLKTANEDNLIFKLGESSSPLHEYCWTGRLIFMFKYWVIGETENEKKKKKVKRSPVSRTINKAYPSLLSPPTRVEWLKRKTATLTEVSIIYDRMYVGWSIS